MINEGSDAAIYLSFSGTLIENGKRGEMGKGGSDIFFQKYGDRRFGQGTYNTRLFLKEHD